MTTTRAATPLGITGIGMVASLGLDAATCCAAARAGILRAAPLGAFTVYSEADWSHVGVVGHAVREYADGFEGFGKLVRLASGAIDDLLRGAQVEAAHWPRTALCVSLADGYLQAALARQPDADAGLDDEANDTDALLAASLLPRLCDLNHMPIPPEKQVALREDASGFTRALETATALIAEGRVDRCIVGGVDACTDARYLTAAHHFGAVRAGDQAAGFQPGEAAAFLLVEPELAARARGAEVLGSILAMATGADAIERAGADAPLGVGLADTIDRCLGALPDGGAQVGWLIANLNGDTFRANDWAYALVRLRARYPHLGECPVDTPAESFGELGAASGPVAACVALRAFARRYAPAPQAMVCLASYGGGRGACVVSASK